MSPRPWIWVTYRSVNFIQKKYFVSTYTTPFDITSPLTNVYFLIIKETHHSCYLKRKGESRITCIRGQHTCSSLLANRSSAIPLNTYTLLKGTYQRGKTSRFNHILTNKCYILTNKFQVAFSCTSIHFLIEKTLCTVSQQTKTIKVFIGYYYLSRSNYSSFS